MVKRIVYLIATIFLIGLVSAVPPMPSAFYGEVSYNGSLVSGNYNIVAKINNVISAECPVVEGRYGYGDNTCVVVSYKEGVDITFYLSDLEIGEAEFSDKEVTRLDFNLSQLPSGSGAVSDGICDVAAGECSYNILDCDASITSACVGNGRCDVEIGETCANAPSDCGACSSSSSSGGSSSSSSSSSGGGSSSSSSGGVIVLASSNDWSCGQWSQCINSTQSRECTKGTENKTETRECDLGFTPISLTEDQDEKSFGSRITGAVVGVADFATSKQGAAMFIAVIVLATMLIVIKRTAFAPEETSSLEEKNL